MEPVTVELEGTLRPDGSLLLDRKPDLPPGRVCVTLRSQVTAEQRFWDTMNTIWEGQKARGHVSRSREEIDAELKAERQEWEDHQQALEHIQEESCRSREQPLC